MSDSDDFEIPVAWVRRAGVPPQLIHPWEGVFGEDAWCPHCDTIVTLKHTSYHPDGRFRAEQHFAHKPPSDGSTPTCAGGKPEGARHINAKNLVAQSVRRWIERKISRPFFTHRCVCGEHVNLPLPYASGVETEYRELSSGLVPDVFVHSKTGKGGAIEILNTSRVDQKKMATYNKDLDWWIEIEAAPVLEDPSRWVVTRSSFKLDACCVVCAEKAMGALAKAQRESEFAMATANDEAQSAMKQAEKTRARIVDLERAKVEAIAAVDAVERRKTVVLADLEAADSSLKKLRLDLSEAIQERAQQVKSASGDLQAVLASIETAKRDMALITENRRATSATIERLRAELARVQASLPPGMTPEMFKDTNLWASIRADTKSLLLRKVALERHVSAMAGTMTKSELADLESWQRHMDRACPGCGLQTLGPSGTCYGCGAFKGTHMPEALS